MKRLTWHRRRRPTALLLAGVLAFAGALAGLVAGPAVPAMAAGGRHTVTVTNPGSQAGTVGTVASLQIQATDSAAGQTLTYTATGLPAGLSISSSAGLITGTPANRSVVRRLCRRQVKRLMTLPLRQNQPSAWSSQPGRHQSMRRTSVLAAATRPARRGTREDYHDPASPASPGPARKASRAYPAP